MENKNFSDLNINCQGRLTNDNEATTEDLTKSTNISSEDIDKEIINKLRGDAIGDTMYSQSSVIRILLQLSDIDWNEKLEEDLCLLWDMTVERDVCEYLYQLSYPSIATAIILKHTEPRLIEIIIGILGNICSNNEIVPDITDIEIAIVLNAMETDDHLILIQIMRFLIAVIYHHRTSKLDFITADIIDKICFILSNSTNKDLLLYTTDALSKITGDFKMESELLNEDVLKSLLISYKFINSQLDKDKDEFDDETIEERKSINLFVQIVLNICLYLNEATSSDLHKRFSNKTNELVREFRIIIQKMGEDSLPLSEDIIFYFESFTIIFPVLNIKYDRDIFLNLFNIINVLSKAHEDKIDACIELMRYIISIGDVHNMIKDVENVNCDKANVFKFILEHKSKCDFNFNNNIVSIIEKLQDNAK